ncbi:hypothetical protein BN3658_01227 [Coriobacteriaceae bacterium CHKCI002]|nr:hypothetical protein BN3658_01227 [Coriobacteriaceae bacterium CHKCI002]
MSRAEWAWRVSRTWSNWSDICLFRFVRVAVLHLFAIA